LIDGVKIINRQNDDWVLILPDAGEPQIHIFANSEDRSWVDTSIREYRRQIQGFIEGEQSKEIVI
jgi:mannose-1-phosphate guanylyltransferase / phosphomannomutase